MTRAVPLRGQGGPTITTVCDLADNKTGNGSEIIDVLGVVFILVCLLIL
jgi:hypothetical protein